MGKKVLKAMKKAGKPLRPRDVAKMLGVESKEVSKIINGLKKEENSYLQKDATIH
jgi:Mn-dependent DtxR family transcriptional regulator